MAGFLTVPGGEFTSANASGVRYDAARRQWLPAGIPTPDRAGYVYTAYNNDGAPTAIHVVTLASGQDRVVVAGSWAAKGFVGTSLYLVESIPTSGAYSGGGYREGRLATTSLVGGAPTFVTQHLGPWWVSDLGAWTLDRADGMLQAPDRVLHVDLATGDVQPWLTGFTNLAIIGFDAAGDPFVVSESGVSVLLVMDPRTSRNVYTGPRDNGWPDSPSVVDGENVWFSGFSIKDPTFEAPVWRYNPDTGLRPSVGVPGAQVSVAGACTA